MKILNEAFNKMFEELIEESAKTDFLDKFGQETLNNFDKAKQRLKNNNMSVDYGQYLKMDKKELDDLILSLYDDKKDAQRKRIIQGTDKEIRGEYNYLGEKDGYKVYQPLDAQASMDLGVNTGWCTTGRYGHYGEPTYTPSEKDARSHWKDYTKNGIKFYYFLNPSNMYGEYAVAVYPKAYNLGMTINKQFIDSLNFEIYDAKDRQDLSAMSKLPLDLIDTELILNAKEFDSNGLYIVDGVVVKALEDVDKIVVPQGIKCIGKTAFSDCKAKEIILPDTLTTIETRAFMRCENLKTIIIPKSVTDVDNFAFMGCSSLSSIVIPKNIRHISDNMFTHCDNLVDVTIEDGIETIGKWAFYGCHALEEISIPNSVVFIGDNTFSYCFKLKKVKLSNNKYFSVTPYMFHNCYSLTSIDIPEGIRKILANAFDGCAELYDIKIPDSLNTIGEQAFCGCSKLKYLFIPNSVDVLADDTFYGCRELTVITDNEYVKDNIKENCPRLKVISTTEYDKLKDSVNTN